MRKLKRLILTVIVLSNVEAWAASGGMPKTLAFIDHPAGPAWTLELEPLDTARLIIANPPSNCGAGTVWMDYFWIGEPLRARIGNELYEMIERRPDSFSNPRVVWAYLDKPGCRIPSSAAEMSLLTLSFRHVRIANAWIEIQLNLTTGEARLLGQLGLANRDSTGQIIETW
jgi:hypothetical protein